MRDFVSVKKVDITCDNVLVCLACSFMYSRNQRRPILRKCGHTYCERCLTEKDSVCWICRKLCPSYAYLHELPPKFKPRLLSLDGGGVRGIILAMVLAKMEELTEFRISDLFDMIGGTSAGGLVGSYLALTENSAASLTSMCQTLPKEVFKESNYRLPKFLGQLIFKDPYYKSEQRRKVIEKNWTKSDQSLVEHFADQYKPESSNCTSFVVTSTMRGDPIICATYPASYRPQDAPTHTCKVSVKDALMATSAAPTYFAAVELNLNGKKVLAYDGGIAANAPTDLLISESFYLFESHPSIIISIGTGLQETKHEINNDGLIYWGSRLASNATNSKGYYKAESRCKQHQWDISRLDPRSLSSYELDDHKHTDSLIKEMKQALEEGSHFYKEVRRSSLKLMARMLYFRVSNFIPDVISKSAKLTLDVLVCPIRSPHKSAEKWIERFKKLSDVSSVEIQVEILGHSGDKPVQKTVISVFSPAENRLGSTSTSFKKKPNFVYEVRGAVRANKLFLPINSVYELNPKSDEGSDEWSNFSFDEDSTSTESQGQNSNF